MTYSLYDLIWLFLCYSFIGWCAEVGMAAIKRRRLIMKGFLNAPFCIIYGFGAVLFAIFLPELENHLFFLFLFGMSIASFLEYITGYFMEQIFQRKWWDYSNKKYNAHGYVSLTYSLVWGLCAVLMIKYINILILRVIQFFPDFIMNILAFIILGIIIADAISVFAALLQMHKNLGKISQLSEDLQKLSESLGNALTRKIQGRIMRAYPNISLEHLTKERVTTATIKPQVFAKGCSFYKLISLFFIGAFIGDIVETIFCYVTSGVLMSRSSVVYGSFSIVWGLGCMMLTALLYRDIDKSDRHIFVAGTILGGAYEYICSVFTELVFGSVFWDYSDIPFNLGGRINLLYCFFWGIVAVVWLKIVYPVLSSWIEQIPKKAGTIGCNILIVFMIGNMIISGLALARYTERNAGAGSSNKVSEFIDQHFPDERIEHIYPNLKIVS